MNWSADPLATLGYKVFVFSDAAGLNVLQTWTDSTYQPGANSRTKTGLTPGTQYWYKVCPKDPSGAMVDGFPVLIDCAMHTFTTAA